MKLTTNKIDNLLPKGQFYDPFNRQLKKWLEVKMQDQNKREFWGIIIPVEILDSTEISANEKIVYGYVASYRKMCLDSNEKIAERLSVSEKTVSRALQKLQDMG